MWVLVLCEVNYLNVAGFVRRVPLDKPDGLQRIKGRIQVDIVIRQQLNLDLAGSIFQSASAIRNAR
jgi:hypothetical protein